MLPSLGLMIHWYLCYPIWVIMLPVAKRQLANFSGDQPNSSNNIRSKQTCWDWLSRFQLYYQLGMAQTSLNKAWHRQKSAHLFTNFLIAFVLLLQSFLRPLIFAQKGCLHICCNLHFFNFHWIQI